MKRDGGEGGDGHRGSKLEAKPVNRVGVPIIGDGRTKLCNRGCGLPAVKGNLCQEHWDKTRAGIKPRVIPPGEGPIGEF